MDKKIKSEWSGFYIDKVINRRENIVERTKIDKQSYVFFAEIMRYISSAGIPDKRNRKILKHRYDKEVYDLNTKEGVAVYSTWQLCSDMEDKRWVGTNATFEIQPSGSRLCFSAHAHPYLPRTPSPDDYLIIAKMKGRSVNYIIDRFVCEEYSLDMFKPYEIKTKPKTPSQPQP